MNMVKILKKSFSFSFNFFFRIHVPIATESMGRGPRLLSLKSVHRVQTCHRDQDRGPLLLLLETRLGSVTTQLVLVMTLDPDLVAGVNDLFYHVSAYQPSKN